MKIMIAGSRPPGISELSFNNICHDIATELARRNVEVILGSERVDTADFQIFECLRNSKAKCKIRIFYHEDKEPPFLNQRDELDVTYDRVIGGWGAGRVPQINEADVVITIGGSNQTQILGMLATYLKKPLVPIFPSGGASVILWERLKPQYSTDARCRALLSDCETWRDKVSASAILDLAIAARSLLRDRSAAKMIALYGMAVSLIVLWFFSFGTTTLPSSISLYVLTASACTLGSLVPLMIDQIKNEGRGLSWQALLLRPIASMLLGFILYITYLFSGYVVHGDLEFFTKIGEPTNFVRVSLIMTVLGVSSGALTDRKLDEIQNKGIGSFN